MIICSAECREWALQNWRWLLVGSAFVCGLYALSGGTLWLLARQLWPSGPPVEIASLAYTEPEIVLGERATMKLEVRKYRECARSASLVFIDANNAEQSFLFTEMPSLQADGKLKAVTFWTVAREMTPGTYRYQVRGTYTCTNGGYTETSELKSVEVVAPAV